MLHFISSTDGQKKIFPFFIAILILLTLLPFCGLGIDLEDAGLHLFFSHNAYTMDGYTWISCPLTNWLMGLWMSLAPIPRMMWWGYLAGAFVYSIFSFFCVKIYFEFFDLKGKFEYLICFFALLAFQPDFGRSLLHYYSLPVMIATIFFYFWIKAEKSSVAKYLPLGMIGMLVFFARMTFITVIFLPVFYFLILWCLEKHDRKETIRKMLLFLSGIVLGSIVMFPLYWAWMRKINLYSQGSEVSAANLSYRILSFLWAFFRLAIDAIPRSIGYLILISVIDSLCIKWKAVRRFSLLTICLAVGAVGLVLCYYYRANKCFSYYGGGLTSFFFEFIIPFAICYCAWILYRYHNISRDDDNVHRLLLIASMFFAASFLIPFGSNIYSLKIGYLLPLYLLIAGGCLYRFPRENIGFSVWGTIIVFAIGAQLSYGYRNPIPFRCDTESTVPELRFMKTSKRRQQIIDRTIREIKNNTVNEKELLLFSFAHFTPLYISGLQNWVDTTTVGNATLISKIRNKMKTVPLPRFALIEGGSEMEELFQKEISDKYVCVYRSEDLPVGNSPPIKYSLWEKK